MIYFMIMYIFNIYYYKNLLAKKYIKNLNNSKLIREDKFPNALI